MAKYSFDKVPVWPPLPTQEELVKVETDKVDQVIAKIIVAGFDFEVNGVTYKFHFDEDDQKNFNFGLNSANISLTMGNADEATQKKMTAENPMVVLPKDWSMAWQGWKDGTSHTLMFDIDGFLKLAAAGSAHLQGQLARGWQMKAALRATKTEDELKDKCKELGIEELLRETSRLK